MPVMLAGPEGSGKGRSGERGEKRVRPLPQAHGFFPWVSRGTIYDFLLRQRWDKQMDAYGKRTYYKQ